jgi:hypothetical protein
MPPHSLFLKVILDYNKNCETWTSKSEVYFNSVSSNLQGDSSFTTGGKNDP